MQHIVYKITNKLNRKYYIGVHSTSNINDGYLGSGTRIKRAVQKYGRENFSKDILKVCSSRKDALLEEASLVDLNDPLIYNLCEGGGNPPSKLGIVNPATTIKGVERTEKQKEAAKYHSLKMKNRPAQNRKPVEILGTKYHSVREAMTKLGWSTSQFYRFQSGN